MKKTIHIVFYNEHELIEISSIQKSKYNIDRFVEKGNFYLSFINHYNEIYEWLKNFIEDISNQTQAEISFKKLRPIREKNIRNIYDYIYSDVKDYYIEDCKRLETLKTMKESFERGKEKYNEENYEERIKRTIENIKQYETGIAQRENLIQYIKKEYLNVINQHVSRFKYGILKENVFKDNISFNNTKRLLESIIIIPQKSHIMVYEEEGYIKNTDLLYYKYKKEEYEKEEEYFDEIQQFFDKIELKYIDSYKIVSFKELLDLYYVEVLNNINIKKCKNCGKYFIANNKQTYCDNISPQNLKYSCRTLPDEIRNKDLKYKLYRQRYQTQNNKLHRNIKVGNISEKELRKRFEKWNELAILKLEECKREEISLEEYKEWFKENQNWINIYR